MRKVWTIASHELGRYFASPIAYLVTAAFLAVSGYLFSLLVLYLRQATLRPLFFNLNVILLFIAPILTMRLLAEERRSGTLELLLTAPVRDGELVLGKFLAAWSFLTFMLLMTLSYPLLLLWLGEPDPWPLVTGYLGVWLLGGACLAFGLLTSALTQNQIVAAVLGIGGLILFWLIDAVQGVWTGPVGRAVAYLSLSAHFPDFVRGVIDLRHVLYYLSFLAASLFLTVRVVESQRWNG